MLRKQGEPVPDGWMLDADGLPTRDPDARARGGAMVPMGGPKGVGLALVLDILCGVLSGASFAGRFSPHGADTTYGAAPDVPFDDGHLFMAIDIKGFMPFDEFTARMEELVETVHASRLAPGVERVYLPDEIEHEQGATRLASGIPLLRSVIEAVEAVGNELGVGRMRLAELSEETTNE
ncbi:MAG: Ldh family oxidoreductase [Planctomycetes bacterium]|nr:Ldh family oxidoreductase [Planctomycetota bacterium]